MNAEAKHKIETANSTQESLLKYYYSRLPERRVNFASTCCGEFLSLQRAIQVANGHETGFFLTTTVFVLSSLVCFSV